MDDAAKEKLRSDLRKRTKARTETADAIEHRIHEAIAADLAD